MKQKSDERGLSDDTRNQRKDRKKQCVEGFAPNFRQVTRI